MPKPPPPVSFTTPRIGPPIAIATRSGVLRATFLSSTLGNREAPVVLPPVLEKLSDLGDALQALVIDATCVEFMNSMGLGMWIDLRHRADAAGAPTIIVGATREIRELLDVVKVERLFQLVASEADLEAALA